MKAYWSRIVRERRKALGFSILGLSIKAGVSENTIKNIEASRGGIAVDNLERVLNALSYDLEIVDAIYGNEAPLAIARDDNAGIAETS
jgi:transcriptional regulator with XRE-family HTH domain